MASTQGLTVSDLKAVVDSIQPEDSGRWLYDRSRPGGLPRFPSEVPDSIYDIRSVDDMWKLQRTVEKYSKPEADEVYPRIFIGNQKAAINSDFLKSKRITHIFNTAEGKDIGEVWVDKSKLDGLKYTAVTMSDMVKASSEKALGLFEKAADTINTILKEDAESRILVNCFGGMSRSTTSVLAYLAIYEKIPADKALAQIKGIRDVYPSNENLSIIVRISNRAMGLKDAGPNQDGLEMDPVRSAARKVLLGKDED